MGHTYPAQPAPAFSPKLLWRIVLHVMVALRNMQSSSRIARNPKSQAAAPRGLSHTSLPNHQRSNDRALGIVVSHQCSLLERRLSASAFSLRLCLFS